MEHGYPKRVTLKSGKTVTLRPPADGDEPALVTFFSRLPPEDTQFLQDDVREPDIARRFVRERDPKHLFALLAVGEDGQIVGDATMHVPLAGWFRHIGEVRVVVAPEVQHQRLATTLIHELVNEASMRRLKRVEAQILDVQLGALTAFKRLGFREEARLRGHALAHDGKVHDLLILTNTVEDLWAKMEDLIEDLDRPPDSY